MKSRIALALLALAAAALGACHTVQGIGKDITYLGERGEAAVTDE
jgi:predicted small secreted protein